MTIARFRYTFLILPLFACEAPDAAGPAEGATVLPREAWSKKDRPSLLGGDFVYTLDALPKSGSAERTPWPGSYWPRFRDSINYRWAGEDSLSPARKYELAFGKSGVEDGVSAAYGVDGADGEQCDSDLDCAEGSYCGRRAGHDWGACIPAWHGICDAWAAAAILEDEPKQAVTYNGVEFKINDLKALITLAYTRDLKIRFMSLRCDEPAAGGDLEDVKECKDTNPGSFHVVLANLLGLRGQSFIQDRVYDFEVWNHPLIAYDVAELEPLTGKQANELLGGGELVTASKTSGEVAKGVLAQVDSIDVAPGQTLRVRTSGSGDIDLYVRWNQEPTLGHHDCRPFEKDSKETCELVAPGYAETAYVAVRGYGVDSTYEVNLEVRDAPGDQYAFNKKAKSLRRVRTEVSYVDEAPITADGRLTDDIDRYTRTSTYEYVLELDGGGKIIGGEWLGSSKTEHPDFLYLPVEKLQGKVAKGKIAWSDVQKLLDLAGE